MRGGGFERWAEAVVLPVARVVGAGIVTFCAVLTIPIFICAIFGIVFALCTFFLFAPLALMAVVWAALAAWWVATAHLAIYFVVLPLVALVVRSNYWMQQTCLLAAGALAGYGLPLWTDPTGGGPFAGAVAGVLASHVFASCVRGLADEPFLKTSEGEGLSCRLCILWSGRGGAA